MTCSPNWRRLLRGPILCSGRRVDDAREQPLNLYPYPAADIVSIADGVYDETSSTQVIDITGRTVIDTRLSRFSVAHLPAGVYTVVRGTTSQMFVVQR